ncbi:hypothetical protein IMZ48_32515 [Candidatus Bathyarchaeota archaeon]|nr:hypothetical protein [Candidatus Bathyarchaeota archaeon]
MPPPPPTTLREPPEERARRSYLLFGVAGLYVAPPGAPGFPPAPGAPAPAPGYPYPPYRLGLALTGRREASPPS